jgi:ADP-heptose:LPS heptosyltransferase
MSFGDEIMASGHALSVHRQTGGRVVIVGRNGRARWSDLWNGLPWIVQPDENRSGAAAIQNGPQCRPYIAYPFSREIGCRYSGWRAQDHVGEIRFTPEETDFAARVTSDIEGFVLIEPGVPEQSNPNKQWGRAKWQALTDILRDQGRIVVQVGAPGTDTMTGAKLIETPSFRYGAAILALAGHAILPEGGLHHAAGALRRPAIVLFGGAVDVAATGYPWHTNVVDNGSHSPCGAWSPCDHCADVWAKLTPEHVASFLPSPN